MYVVYHLIMGRKVCEVGEVWGDRAVIVQVM